MAILPAVYVTIEDQSYALPTIESGRVGFIVLLSDRGVHNKVVQINSPQELAIKYGKPDIDRTGQAHYIAEKFLQYSSRLYLVRPVLLDDPLEANNASISNVYIKYNNLEGNSQLYSSSAFKFLFSNSNSDKVIVNAVTFENFEIGDLIYRIDDESSSAVKIIDKYIDTASSDYILKLEHPYAGTFNLEGHVIMNPNPSYKLSFTAGSDEVLGSDLLTYNFIDVGDRIGTEYDNAKYVIEKTRTVTPTGTIYTFKLESAFDGPTVVTTYNFVKIIYWDTEVYKFYPGPQQLSESDYIFTTSSNLVTVTSLAAFQEVKVKDWIFPSGENSNVDSSHMRQVISKYIDDNRYILVLDAPYIGPSTINSNGQHVKRYRTFEVMSFANIKQENNISATDSDNLWTFYAQGAGTYYNNLYLVGVRNVQYENLYVDIEGNPIYKYAFMDLYLYEKDDTTGNSTMLEGPWTVSLIRTIPNGQVVRDINTGNELYIENVINLNSQHLKCVSALGVSKLLFHEDAAIYRLQVMSLFSEEQVYKENTLGENGLRFAKGEDGCQYDPVTGRLNAANEKIQGIVQEVYKATMLSDDQSIENLPNVLYPWYKFDYILSGGYSASIQNAARELADRRNDCMLLADTGYQVRADDELAIRKSSNGYNWNTWNAMLYVTYRQIFDSHTGKNIWVSPVYHAIERHLYVDAQYWISEPVAGIEKGAISQPITLAYRSNVTKLEDMISVELNPTIVEPDGVYLLTQFTTWKRLSVMKRAHAVKFVHYIRKQLPSLLKDILQRKMTPFWINLAYQRVTGFMQPFLVNATGSERYASITSFSVEVIADEARNELRVILTIRPVRVIEAIHVNIIVK